MAGLLYQQEVIKGSWSLFAHSVRYTMRFYTVLVLSICLSGAFAGTIEAVPGSPVQNQDKEVPAIQEFVQKGQDVVAAPEGVTVKEDAKETVTEPTNPEQKVDQIKAESSDEKITYEGVQVVRVLIDKKEKANFIKDLSTDGEVSTWLNNGSTIDVVVRNPKTLDSFKAKEIDYEIIIQDLQKAIQDENPKISEEEWNELTGRNVTAYSPRGAAVNVGVGHFPYMMRTRLGLKKFHPVYTKNYYDLRWPPKKKTDKSKGHRMTWQMYHRMSDIHSYLDYLAATYPQNVTVRTIGKSVEGRPLKVLEYKSGQPNRPAIWVDAGIHAREWITPASLTYILSQMIENGDGTRNVDWYFNPLVNPDGYEHSHSRDRLWRKNRANPEKGSCAGTDLNRNFGYKWGGQGASRQPCRETYAGSAAFSEPETAAIQKFIASKQGQIKGSVSLHSYGQYILYPWGYDRKVPVDYQDLERVGRQMASAIRGVGGPAYTVGSAANTLYPASGGSDDWAKGSAKIKYAYTVELRDTGRHGFVLPAAYIVPSAKDAYAALDVLAKELAKS